MTDCVLQGPFATGVVQLSGLTKGGKVTKVSVNDAGWTALPAIALPERNAIAVQNRSGVAVRINYDYTGPLPGNDDGMELNGFGERQYDITDKIVLYARVVAGGGTIDLWCEEIA
jgi:hypothetical protein